MKRMTKHSLLFSLMVLLIVSCAPATPAATATGVIPTRTTVPTRTNTPVPSPTATLSQVEAMFIIPTMQPYLDITPTPLATPSLTASSMRLRDLSEEDYLHLISVMHEYSYQNFPPVLGWWTEGNFIESQSPVALVMQEYLYRDPESANAERLQWQLAFINSIKSAGVPGNQYDDDWIISELERELNQGDAAPDMLENILGQYWFDIAYSQPIENLFNDGEIAWLHEITPQAWEEDEIENVTESDGSSLHGGLFIVVRQLAPKEFQLFHLHSAWGFSFADSSVLDITDHNQNGIPEIILYIGYHSGTMCSGNLLVYEWKTDVFVELTKNNIYLRDCMENFETSIVDQVPAILHHASMPSRTERYVWDGEYYEFAGYESASLVDKWWSVTGFFPEEAEAIKAILSSRDTEGISPSQTDFLMFRLGIVSALNSDPTQAKQVLQELIEHPADETRTIYSDFAKNFLQYYSDDKSLLLACRKSREFYDTVTDSSENEEDLFGIPFDFIFGSGLLGCFDRDVFELLVAEIPVTVEDIPAELHNYGVNLYYAEKQDVNLDDSVDEWLMTFDNDIFVVIPNGSHYEAVILGNFWYDEEAYQYSTVELKIERWPGIQNPILTVRTDQELSILGIGDDYDSKELGFDFDVKDVVFSSQETPPEYQVFSIKPDPGKDYYGVPWIGYRWDAESQKFRDDLIEYTLFVEQDPKKASKIADVLGPFLMTWRGVDEVEYWLPRYFYLCGLAYELSGDPQMAAETYWQVWRDFPGSHYARMARYKLESSMP